MTRLALIAAVLLVTSACTQLPPPPLAADPDADGDAGDDTAAPDVRDTSGDPGVHDVGGDAPADAFDAANNGNNGNNGGADGGNNGNNGNNGGPCAGVDDGTVLTFGAFGPCAGGVDGCTGTRDRVNRVCRDGREISETERSPCSLDSPEEDMVCVPAGPFWMGCNGALDERCDPQDELPQHEVTLGSYLIDAHEVTVAAYRACVDDGACSLPPTNDVEACFGYCNWGQEDADPHPVNGVTWDQAQSYCTWSGGRLPTEAEWEKAARGGCDIWTDDCAAQTGTYPWGNSEPDCSLAVYSDGQGFGCGTMRTAAVGGKASGASPYEAYDMAGNVWEWVADVYAADYYGSNQVWDNPTGPGGDGLRVVRGGTLTLGTFSLRSANRERYARDTVRGDIGFRCVRELE